MKRNQLLTLLFLTSLFTAWAGNNRYRLILTDNPSSTIMIGWNQTSGSNPTIYYGTTDHETNWQLYANSKAVDRSIDFNFMKNTFAKLSDLLPNTVHSLISKTS